MEVKDFLKPVALWTNLALAAYAVAVFYKPDLAETISTEIILGIAAALNSVLLGYERLKEAS